MKKYIGLGVVMILATCIPTKSQTAQTHCTTSGNNTNCTTTDPTAGYNSAGYALGAGLGIAIDRHKVESFCKKNPGQNYKGHQCPTEYQRAVFALQAFIVATPKFRQSDHNIEILGGWIDAHQLDRGDQKSYKRAWDALKKTGGLELNK